MENIDSVKARNKKPKPRKRKILLIDDDEDIRELIAFYLPEERFETKTAANGKEGLKMLEEFKPDLVILDLLMPVMDGIQFLDALRQDPHFFDLPVVVATAKRVIPKEAWRIEKEAAAILTKDETFEEQLKRALRDIFQTK